MRTYLALLRPTSLWQWLVYVMAGLFVFMYFAFFTIGDTDLQRLRDHGVDDTVRIVRVISTDNGRPTKVEVEGGTPQQPLILDELAGSVVGDEVRVRTIPGDVVWSQTKYHSESLLKGTLVVVLWPILISVGLVFGANLRYHLKPTSNFTWSPSNKA